MNSSDKASRLTGKGIVLAVVFAVLAAVAAHAVQVLLLGEASTVVSAGVASVIAIITIIGVGKRR